MRNLSELNCCSFTVICLLRWICCSLELRCSSIGLFCEIKTMCNLVFLAAKDQLQRRVSSTGGQRVTTFSFRINNPTSRYYRRNVYPSHVEVLVFENSQVVKHQF